MGACYKFKISALAVEEDVKGCGVYVCVWGGGGSVTGSGCKSNFNSFIQRCLLLYKPGLTFTWFSNVDATLTRYILCSCWVAYL